MRFWQVADKPVTAAHRGALNINPNVLVIKDVDVTLDGMETEED